MAGGIFPGQPFSFNWKCVIFTFILAGGYWYLPHRNPWILAFLIWFPYLALAWYDYSYGCKNKIKPNMVPFGRYIWVPFKPKEYQEEFKKLPTEPMDRLDHLAGWTIVTGLAIYYVYKNKR